MNYEILYDFDKLYEAYKKCRRGKTGKTEVILFELNLMEELVKLQKELKNKTYRAGEYYRFVIYDPKQREIQALPFRDRMKRSREKDFPWEIRQASGLLYIIWMG